MELVSEAIIFAVNAHDNMRRKKGESPYILHPMEAAAIVGSMTDKQEVIAAAALHDVIEDAGVSFSEIEEKFGKRVCELVSAETENKREELPAEETWLIRKVETLEVLKNTDDEDVLILWIGDKLSNMRAIYRQFIESGEAMWEAFHQKDPKVQAWYYKTVVKATEKLSSYPAWLEYKRLTDLVFGEDE